MVAGRRGRVRRLVRAVHGQAQPAVHRRGQADRPSRCDVRQRQRLHLRAGDRDGHHDDHRGHADPRPALARLLEDPPGGAHSRVAGPGSGHLPAVRQLGKRGAGQLRGRGRAVGERAPQPGPARFQLLATLFDLAARQINASTQIDSKLTRKLGTRTVGEAVRYGFATLALPVNSSTAQRYSEATTLLDEIVNNKSEVY
ncbi:hypothetical protein [Nonomuraea dietziae]|uniref:hypothetical protein n=1 Tax=Nonomuraea dietziae TaxID=65515 RepID=UPI0031D28521